MIFGQSFLERIEVILGFQTESENAPKYTKLSLTRYLNIEGTRKT